MGPPGGGKGTAASFIAKHYNIPHISTGDIFRSLNKTQTEIGKKVKTYLDKGELVPDEITNLIVYERLLEEDAKNGFLLDGFPRNVNQAEALDRYLKKQNKNLDVVLNLLAPDELIIERISGRRVCEKCGAIFHIKTLKPKVEGICDKDGSKLIQRVDDNEATVQKRLQIYYDQTKPVVDYYKEKRSVISLDGTKSIEEVQTQIMKALGEMI
jgi:adenylate kinase